MAKSLLQQEFEKRLPELRGIPALPGELDVDENGIYVDDAIALYYDIFQAGYQSATPYDPNNTVNS